MVLSELLAPAGSYDVLVIAVNAGADAVYIAGQQYGARAFAKNFTMEEIEKAVEYAAASPFPPISSAVEDVYTDIVEEGRNR